MIQELVSLSGRLRARKLVHYMHDALDNVPISITCEINRKGVFKQFIVAEKKKDSIAEALTSKKGKARLLVDKPEEVLEFGEKAKGKHKLFMEKLKEYEDARTLIPVLAFYGANKTKGVNEARKAFPKQVDEKSRTGNIAFKLTDDNKWIHDAPEIRKAIVENYKKNLKEFKVPRFPVCSICGSSEYPVTDEFPHGMIKRVPDGQSSGCALVSYNENAFESYNFKGNENASICTHCARGYVESLNWLLRPSFWKPGKKGRDVPVFNNRKDISADTAVIFWLRDEVNSDDLDLLDNPDEGKIREMMRSVESGQAVLARKMKTDTFYAITLSGAAARIAVRDWIVTSLPNLRANLVRWFEDISIGEYDKDKKKINTQFARFWNLVSSAKSNGGKDVQHGRIGATLWKCAVLDVAPPLWLLGVVLNRIRAEQGNTTTERMALLKLYLNRRTNHRGGMIYMATRDETNDNIAYVCGQIFSVLESIQYFALGSGINAGIRQRFFSFASTMPSTAFGRLMKLTQHHLSKIRGENTGLAINLDRKLQELMGKVKGTRFPVVFSLEDQASFALGYYHQQQENFATKSNNKEN